MPGRLLAILVLSFSCAPLSAADRPPDPVDSAILEAPAAEHVPVLIAALNGSGCQPRHSEVGDALVQIGMPAVAPLVERLNGSTKWWIQLECIHLLGLMGTEAAAAEPDLARFLVEQHHGLPQSFARASLAAVRDDPQALIEVIATSHSGVAVYSLELLKQMGADAAPVVPQLREYVLRATDRRGSLAADFLADYDAESALTTEDD